jgi:hypothetical protein
MSKMESKMFKSCYFRGGECITRAEIADTATAAVEAAVEAEAEAAAPAAEAEAAAPAAADEEDWVDLNGKLLQTFIPCVHQQPTESLLASFGKFVRNLQL